MAIRILTLFFLLPVLCYSQNTFTLAELIRMNELPEDALTKEMVHKNFSIENRFHDTISKALLLNFRDTSGQKLSKNWDEDANAVNYHTSFELDFPAYRKELLQEGFKLTDKLTGENEAVTELYEKNMQVISLYCSVAQSDGSPPVYEVDVSNGKGGSISTHDF
ncbi:MAG: hypothetical protein ACJ75B_19505 [Flavisolibacter sp.]